jgi:hypothetical protein
MEMTGVFTAFAAGAAALGWLMPHLVHRLGFRMALLYLALALIAALISLVRRPG